jgi:predicted N-acetyltransferase YhbS
MSLSIRQETLPDHAPVEALVAEAFRAAEHSDGSEAALVARLRRSPHFIPELSLVAELDGRLAGHVLLSQIEIVGQMGRLHRSLALAPVSVLPSLQRRGIGSELIRRGHEIAARLGHASVILVGHPEYYPRFGYAPASRWAITAPFAVPDEAFLALELRADGLRDVSGQVRYPPEFGI